MNFVEDRIGTEATAWQLAMMTPVLPMRSGPAFSPSRAGSRGGR